MFRIEQLPCQPILFLRRTGPYGSENGKLMEALKKWAAPKGLLTNSVIYGIAQDGPDTPPEACRYDVCLAVSAHTPADETVQRGEIPGGKYAVFRIPHTPEAVQEFWGSVFAVLQEHNLRFHGEQPILERYQEGLVAEGFCEFCVPIQ